MKIEFLFSVIHNFDQYSAQEISIFLKSHYKILNVVRFDPSFNEGNCTVKVKSNLNDVLFNLNPSDIGNEKIFGEIIQKNAQEIENLRNQLLEFVGNEDLVSNQSNHQELDHLRKTINELEATNSKIEAKLINNQEEITKLLTENESLQALAKIKSNLNSSNNFKNMKAEEKIHFLENKLSMQLIEYEKSIKDIQLSYNQAKMKLIDNDDKIKEIENSHLELINIKEKYDNEHKEYQKLQEESNNDKIKLINYESNVKKLSEKYSQIKSRNKEMKKLVQQLQKDNIELENKSSKLIQAQVNEDELVERGQILSHEVEKLTNENRKMKDLLDDYITKNDRQSSLIKEYEESNLKYLTENSNLKANALKSGIGKKFDSSNEIQLTEKQSKKNLKKNEISLESDYKLKIEDFKNEIFNRDKQILKKEEECNGMKNKVHDLEKIIYQMKLKEEETNKVFSLQTENELLIKELTRNIDLLQSEKLETEKERKRGKEKENNLESKENDYLRIIQNYKEDLNIYSTKIEEFEKDISKANQTISNQSKEIKEYKLMNQEIIEEAKEMERRKNDLEIKIEKIKQKYKILKEELKKLKENNNVILIRRIL